VLRDLVARKRDVGGLAIGRDRRRAERDRRELVAVHQVVLLVDDAAAGGRRYGRGRDTLEAIDDALRQPAALRIHQTAEIALTHAVGGEQAVLIQLVAAVVGLECGEPEGFIFAVVDLREIDRSTGSEGELVVLERGVGPVRGRVGPWRRAECRVAVVPERRAVEAVGAALGGRADHAAPGREYSAEKAVVFTVISCTVSGEKLTIVRARLTPVLLVPSAIMRVLSGRPPLTLMLHPGQVVSVRIIGFSLPGSPLTLGCTIARSSTLRLTSGTSCSSRDVIVWLVVRDSRLSIAIPAATVTCVSTAPV